MNKEGIFVLLKNVKDPELGINIVDMGLIYNVSFKNEKEVVIKMTLTTPMCPLGGSIIADVENTLKAKGLNPKIDLVFDPPWSPDKLSKELRDKLGL